MVAKCANPTCSARFRYLHEGELYVIELKADSLKHVPSADPDYIGNSHAYEHFWLCSSCSCAMRVQTDREGRIILVPKRKVQLVVSGMEDGPPMVA